MSLCVLVRSSDTTEARRVWNTVTRQTDPVFIVHMVREAADLFTARSETVPGLNLEAESERELVEEIRSWAPELLIENGVVGPHQSFSLVISASGTAQHTFSM